MSVKIVLLILVRAAFASLLNQLDLTLAQEWPQFLSMADHVSVGWTTSYADWTTSYGSPDFVTTEDFASLSEFADIADGFLGKGESNNPSSAWANWRSLFWNVLDDNVWGRNNFVFLSLKLQAAGDYIMPEHLATFQDNMEDLKSYGAGLILALQRPHADVDLQAAQKLRETADWMLVLLRRENEDDMDDAPSIQTMSKIQEDLLRRCLAIYLEHARSPVQVGSVQLMSRAELEDLAINLWKHRGGLRSQLPEGGALPERFVKVWGELGFTAEERADGLWNYVILGGATLPAMYKRALFLEDSCLHFGLVPENLILLASGRKVDGNVDFVPELDMALDDCETEADLAEKLRQHFERNLGNGHLAKMWSHASVVKTSTERAGFLETLNQWLHTAPAPGSVLVLSSQPFIPRFRVQLLRRLHASPFQKERAEVIGGPLCKVYRTTKSSVLLDAIGHWVQAQRENT